MNVTWNVINDLWPVYESGEASDDTRAIVEAFLAADPEFARRLRSAPVVAEGAVPAARKDGETAALERTRDLVYGRRPGLRGLRLLATVLSIFAGSQLIQDTAWIRSPRVFLARLTAAVVCWIGYVLLLRHYRARALRPAAPSRG